MLYKGSLANIVAEGRFDIEWRIAAVDAEKIKTMGAVTVK